MQQDEAARIAVETVRAHLATADPDLKVVFDVFTDRDQHIYQDLLSRARTA